MNFKSIVVVILFKINIGLSTRLSNKCNFTSMNYQVQRNINCRNIYIWKSERDDFLSLLNKTYHKFRGTTLGALRGKTIRVLIHEMYPYVMVNSTGQLDGFVGNFWTDLQRMLQFENNFIIERNFDVALEKMVDGQADVFLGAIVSNAKLNRVTIYSQPYLYNWYHVGFREPDDGGSSDLYLNAFNKVLLLSGIGIYLVMALILWAGLKLLRVYSKQKQVMSFPSCLIAVFSGFLNQATDLNIKYYSMRILILTALVFGYIIYTSLNAVLVSQLTNSRGDLTVNSLEEVATKSGYSLCVRNNSFVYNYFLDENKELLPKWKHIVNGKGCIDITELENLAAIICNRDVIILENRAVIASVYNRYTIQCNMHYLPEHLFPTYNFIVYHKNFDNQYLLSRSLKRIKSCGILNHLEEKWFDIKSSFSFDGGSTSTPAVNLYHISGILIMLLGMIFLSLVLLVCEILSNKYNEGKNAQGHKEKSVSRIKY